MEKPTNDDIEKFIKVFDQLCQFEASSRVVRGHGAFKESDLPFTEVVKVTSWLKQRIATSEKDILDSLIKKYERKADDLRVESASAHARNDYISYSTLNEEADIYEELLKDLKNIGGFKKIKK